MFQVIRGIRHFNEISTNSALGSSLKTAPAKTIVTIGNFDGVHLGHRAILNRVIAGAKSHKATSVLMTFFPHPRSVLNPEARFGRLFTIEDQEAMLSELGIDIMIQEPFSRDLSELAPDVFFRDWVLRPLDPIKIVVGYDFSFGKNRAGSLDVLRELCARSKVGLEIIEAQKVDEQVISSSRIREALMAGDVVLANKMLDRRFFVEGLVERGDGRGRTIGVPTANVHVETGLVPSVGVYVTRTQVRGQWLNSVTNIGQRPTFNPKDGNHDRLARVETHILDFSEDLYGAKVKVQFIAHVRDERRFESVQALVSQIQADIGFARMTLEEGAGG